MFLQFFVPAGKVLDVIMEKLEMCPFADGQVDSGNEHWYIVFFEMPLAHEFLQCW